MEKYYGIRCPRQLCIPLALSSLAGHHLLLDLDPILCQGVGANGATYISGLAATLIAQLPHGPSAKSLSLSHYLSVALSIVLSLSLAELRTCLAHCAEGNKLHWMRNARIPAITKMFPAKWNAHWNGATIMSKECITPNNNNNNKKKMKTDSETACWVLSYSWITKGLS